MNVKRRVNNCRRIRYEAPFAEAVKTFLDRLSSFLAAVASLTSLSSPRRFRTWDISKSVVVPCQGEARLIDRR